MQPTVFRQMLNLKEGNPSVESQDQTLLNHQVWLETDGTKWLLETLYSKQMELVLDIAKNTIADESILRALSAELMSVTKTINLILDRNYEC